MNDQITATLIHKSHPNNANLLNFASPITRLKGIGPKNALYFKKLGIETVQDLLFNLPLRYQDRTQIWRIGDIRSGQSITLEGEIVQTHIVFAKKRMLVSKISDGSGTINLRFFHFSKQQQLNLAKGTRIRCFGEVRYSRAYGYEIIHPEYRRIDAYHDDITLENFLTPIYPSTEGLGQATLRAVVNQLFDDVQRLKINIPQLLPDSYLVQLETKLGGEPTALDSSHYKRFDLPNALAYLHHPPAECDVQAIETGKHPAQRTLIAEELLAHFISLKRKRFLYQQNRAPGCNFDFSLQHNFVASLDFELTRAQKRVIETINSDLQNSFPMQRLVQGDVGSGKTVVAAAACLQVIHSGYQVALMAPTEILANQHYQSMLNWFAHYSINVVLLTSKITGQSRQNTLNDIHNGSAHLIVGTHALFQAAVEFAQLGLIVVDEQHRFGVQQRLSLRNKGSTEDSPADVQRFYPHQLIMTATPIPRTLAMTLYADLDCSVIDELPPGRKPVETVAIPQERRNEVIERVYQSCKRGKQTYWVCTLIDESESIESQAAEDTLRDLQQEMPGISIAMVHGRMKAQEKENIIENFKSRRIDVLVATTVIEVGVDIPNASLMIIENAERLGLSQLHQLRGRVGRGDKKSVCVLLYRHPLSQHAKQRLAIMRDSNDGFEIARQDLLQRGPGEVLGTRQTGLNQLKVADLSRDQALLPIVAEWAESLLKHQPHLAAAIIERWIGSNTQYGEV